GNYPGESEAGRSPADSRPVAERAGPWCEAVARPDELGELSQEGDEYDPLRLSRAGAPYLRVTECQAGRTQADLRRGNPKSRVSCGDSAGRVGGVEGSGILFLMGHGCRPGASGRAVRPADGEAGRESVHIRLPDVVPHDRLRRRAGEGISAGTTASEDRPD